MFIKRPQIIAYVPITRRVQRIVLSDIIYFFEVIRLSGIPEGNKNEYCVVRTQNWH
jgi:hypothetical protein